jgi:hypothetical protein
MVRNLTKRLKTHFQNGSISFSNWSFPPKRNILGAMNVERYGQRFMSVLGVSCGLLSEQTVRNIVKWLKTHFSNGSFKYFGGPFTPKCNILGGIIAESYDHRFSSPKLQFSLFFGLSGLLQAS